MKLSILAMFLLLFLVGFPQGEKQAIVYVKHLEPPLHYPALGRQTQIQGTVIVKLTIAADGTVLAAKALTRDQDPQSNAHPLLKDETEKFVKNWTFGCAYCSPNVPYERTMRFIYRLEGEGVSYDDTRVVMELPDQVTITASPPECDHCPLRKSSRGGAK